MYEKTGTYDANFQKCNAIGLQGEQDLIAYLKECYHVKRVAQMAGKTTDLVCTSKKTGRVYQVEVKTDAIAHGTGNAFIEIESNSATKAMGWALSCQSDLIAYYLPQWRRVYWLEPSTIRSKLADWKEMYPQKRSFNPPNYYGSGVLVPIAEISKIARWVRDI